MIALNTTDCNDCIAAVLHSICQQELQFTDLVARQFLACQIVSLDVKRGHVELIESEELTHTRRNNELLNWGGKVTEAHTGERHGCRLTE